MKTPELSPGFDGRIINDQDFTVGNLPNREVIQGEKERNFMERAGAWQDKNLKALTITGEGLGALGIASHLLTYFKEGNNLDLAMSAAGVPLCGTLLLAYFRLQKLLKDKFKNK